MNEWLSILLFILGFVLILKGGDLLVESSVWFAKMTKIPSMIIGATIVSIATTFPETTVAFIASIGGEEELAMNTSIGSIICNFTLVLGLSFTFLPTKIDSGAFLKKVLFFLAVLVLFVLCAIDKKIGVFDSVILLFMFAIFIITNIKEAKKTTLDENSLSPRPSAVYIVLQFMISAFAIGYGASVLVKNVSNISSIFGISEDVVGLSIIALGTNIPEIVTTIDSIKRKMPEIGIGNIFGASIINATMLIGGATLLAPDSIISLNWFMLFVSVPLLFLTLAVVALPIMKKNKSNRFQGILLLGLYALYSILLGVLL